MASPYENCDPKDWLEKTRELVDQHPIAQEEWAELVLDSWKDILTTGFGSKPHRIGHDVFPSPQVLGFFLHELIALKVVALFPETWAREATARDKDLVFLADSFFSVEIKTSSHKNQVFGNRSFAVQESVAKKSKSGYYLTVNFESFRETQTPRIRLIRFGWLDHSDWQGQTAQSGQQASLSKQVYSSKLITLFLQ